MPELREAPRFEGQPAAAATPEKSAFGLGGIGVARAIAVGLLGLSAGLYSLWALVERLGDGDPVRHAKLLIALAVCAAGLLALALAFVMFALRASRQYQRQARALSKTVALLRETLDALPVGVTLYDRDERLLVCNEAAIKVNPHLAAPDAIGKTYEEITRQLLREAGVPADMFDKVVAEFISRFRSKGGRHEFKRDDGSWIEASERATPSGGTVGLRIDITEIKRREQEIARSRDLIQETLDALPVGVTVFDRDERLILYNRAANSILSNLLTPASLGRKFDEMIVELLRHFGLPEEEVRAQLPQHVERFRTKGRRDVVGLPDGRWIEATETAAASGRTIGVRIDISEIKRKEQEIVHSRDLLQTMIDAIPAGVELYDKDDRLVVFNKASTVMSSDVIGPHALGRTFAELAGESAALQRKLGTGDAVSVEQLVERFNDHTLVQVRQSPDGRWIERFERAVPEGGTVGLRIDVTELKSQQVELERSHALLQETIDVLPAGVTLWDEDERLVMFNAVAASINPRLNLRDSIGKPYTEIVGALVSEIEKAGGTAPPDWLSGFRAKSERRLLQLPDGRWFEWSESQTSSGHTVGLRVDVSELKGREMELERARTEYELLVDSLSDIVYRIDPTGRFLFVSAASRQMIGVVPEEMIGRPFLDFVIPEDAGKIRSLGEFVHRTAGDSVHELRFRMKTAQGGSRWFEVRSRNVVDSSGRSTMRIGILRDIDSRVALEERLASEMERLRSVVQSSGASIVLTDRNLNIVMANDEYFRSIGLDPNQVIGTNFRSLSRTAISQEVVDRWQVGALTPDRAQPVRYTKTRADAEGRERIYSITARPILDDRHMLRQIVFLGVDDTERRDAERMLVETERLAMVGEMAATVAHEIAQPLQVINVANASARLEVEEAVEAGKPIDDKFITSKLDRIDQQISRANRIVDELRAYVRGASNDEIQRFDPGIALHGTVDLVQHALRSAGVKIRLGIEGELPAITGHLSRLEQVLVNLVNNARDAGGRAIDLAAQTVGAGEGRRLRITVDDNGPGIPEVLLPKLFQSFVTTKPRGKGTGLGLRICRRIIEEMGGSISASNRPEGGARFEILLPTAEE